MTEAIIYTEYPSFKLFCINNDTYICIMNFVNKIHLYKKSFLCKFHKLIILKLNKL